MSYSYLFIILISIILIFNLCKNSNNLLGGSLEFYDIKKYFKCDFTEKDNLIEKIGISLNECLKKCLNDLSCTCLHYNLFKKQCFLKKKKLDISLDDKSLIKDRNFTSYIKKNNIRNLSKNYIFITLVENPDNYIYNESLKIVSYTSIEGIKLNNEIKDLMQYSFFLKNMNTNDIISNILTIRPFIKYSLGYIDLKTQIEKETDYIIMFDTVIMNEFYKISIYKVYNPINIYIYNTTLTSSKPLNISPHKFNLYVLNKNISENVSISSETSNVELFNKKKYYISYHNFNSSISKKKHSNKVFSTNSSNINAIWDFYLKKNDEGNSIFCNKKYSFKKNSITNKNCYINRIWKINYNNYNNTFDFKCIDSELNNKVLEIKNNLNKNIKQFNLIINNIVRIKNKPYYKIYYKIKNPNSIDFYTNNLFINKYPSNKIILNKFCYHYLKLNNIKMQHPNKPFISLKEITSNTKSNGKKIDDFNSCIEACEETNNSDNECIYLNFIANKPEETYNTSNKHAYLKSKVENLPRISCNYYNKDINSIEKHNYISHNNSIHLEKFNYMCNNKIMNKPIQELLFEDNSYYTSDEDKNKNLLWNIELSDYKYKKYKNKKYSLNKIEPPKLKPDFYWTNLKKNIGEIGMGLSCQNYSELNLKDIEENKKELNKLINSCSENNCNFNLLKEKCNNDPLCTNFQISNDKKNCYLSYLNNINLLEKDDNIDNNKKITTYYKQT